MKKYLLCALCVLCGYSLTAKGVPAPLKAHFQGHTYTIHFPERDLWSQSEIARTTWPLLQAQPQPPDAKPQPPFPAAQMRVRGLAGDRAARNYLVVNLTTGKLIAPDPKYFVRADPFGGLGMASGVLVPPAPPALAQAPSAKPQTPSPKSLGPPAARLVLWSWDRRPEEVDPVTFVIQTSPDLSHWSDQSYLVEALGETNRTWLWPQDQPSQFLRVGAHW